MRITVAVLALSATLWMAGCWHPDPPEEVAARPSDVLDFTVLYQANCAACHGANGSGGAAIDLANPKFQALIDDATLRKIVASGVPNSQMPAFARDKAGNLTPQQIDVIVAGMRKAWGHSNAFSGATPPPYAQSGGDAQRGHQTYQVRCAICHKSSNDQITSPAYLALVSDQSLRTYTIAGSPDIGQPDWQHDSVDGKATTPLSAQDVSDVVAYLASLRNATPADLSNSPSTQPTPTKAR